MARAIKNMAKFSEDALEMALKTMSTKDREQFERGCNVLMTSLGKKEKGPSDSKRRKISDDYIFETNIVPQIRRKIAEIEAAETIGKLKIDIDFKSLTNLDEKCDMEKIKKEHVHLLKLESNLQGLTLFAQFGRGRLYFTLSKSIQRGEKSFNQIVEEELDVSYRTVLRYMAFSNVILNFPRLILCDLSFSQILKHKDRLLKYLESKEGQSIRDSLSLSIEVIAQGQKVTIEQQDMPMFRKVKFNTDPDWAHHDKAATNDDVSKDILQDLAGPSKETNEIEDLEDFL